MKFRFCPQCGNRLAEKQVGDEGNVPFCETCERPWFGFSYPCVICLVTDGEGSVALIRQSYGTKNYVCVAGYVKEQETAEETVVREIREEIGLEVQKLRYVNSYFYPKHDNLMLGYVCTVKREQFRLSGEVERAEWFTADEAEERLSRSLVAGRLLKDCRGLL